jgi:hypothetical protein
MNPRRRLLFVSIAVLVVAWTVALCGFLWSRASKVTPERVAAYLRSLDWKSLSSAQRVAAIRKLADWLNKLSPDDRRRVRMDPRFRDLFRDFSMEDKEAFLEQTIPTGLNQMLAAFEQMPEERRRRAIGESIRRLREARDRGEGMEGPGGGSGPGGPSDVSPELQEKVVKLGLKSFYENSSADLKVEVSPLLEEIQRSMENGRIFRPRRGEGRE